MLGCGGWLVGRLGTGFVASFEIQGLRGWYESCVGADEFLSLGCRSGRLYRRLVVFDAAVTLCARGMTDGQRRLA
jgi:hypothetical protein